MIKQLAIVLATVMLVACSGSREDVRVTLCKDLVSEINSQAGTPSWDKEEVAYKGYEDMEVAISFSQSGSQSNISCFYPYDTADENVMTHANPASAYDTYPSAVKFNGELLDSKDLASKINRVLIKQGKRAIAKGQEAIKTTLQ